MENKALQTASNDSLEQLEQRKKEYIGLISNDEEKEFVDCFFLTPIRDSSVKVISKVIHEITELRLFVGAIKDVDSKQIQFEAQTIAKNYSFLTLEEIQLAFKLFSQNKLMPLDRVLNYPNFSSLFISQIINSYIEYRQDLINQLNNRKKPLIEYKPSAIEQEEDMRYMIEEVHKLINEGTYYIVLLNTVFNFLYRTKRINPTKEELYEASRYADKKYLAKKATQTAQVADLLSGNHKPKNKEHCIETFTREFCLIKYFKIKPLSEILNEITENDFNKQ